MFAGYWKRHRVASVVFVVAAIVAAAFAIRLVAFAIYWSEPSHRRQPIEPWMTAGYAARSWGVPRDAVLDALGMTADEAARRSLEEIAAGRGVSVETVVGIVEDAVGAATGREP